MNLIGSMIIGYIFFALIIHWFCENIVLRIPLLDQYALAIRNFLCIIALILTIIVGIVEAFKGNHS